MNKDVFAVPLASLPRLPTLERELTKHPPESTPFVGLEAERGSVCFSLEIGAPACVAATRSCVLHSTEIAF